MKHKIKVICAWCKAEMPPGAADKPGIVSHGICKKCRRKYFPESLKPSVLYCYKTEKEAVAASQARIRPKLPKKGGKK